MQKKEQIEPFEYLDHTADIEFIARGKNLKDAFSNAAKAFSNSIVELSEVKNTQMELVEISSESIEACLFDFLTQLLVLHETKHIIYCDFEIKSLRRDVDSEGNNCWYLLCKAFGEKLDISRHNVDAYVKAITYSQMKIQRESKGFSIQMVLDI